ncbi:thioesterase [Ruminiclostridium herbifermentans]|uniref:Thioesterase n=1 Tax=Ruminiclostridium herbifermentans TaxID=2488810 RepID=A0A4U7JHZ0_9FIRM|nr:thioesterase domain-containing protein [Ruminiclostridium herbifermentans]QNU66696.1 thioesterase [Ruminiclostridium herbifermentans]
MNKIKLFCLPYAGGSSLVYKKWENYLDNSIKLNMLELAGRGSRSKEPYYNSMEEAVEDIFSIVKANTDDNEYAIFGHSMGTILAYKLAAKIKDSNMKQPLHLFISGRYPPNIKKEERNIYLLPEEEFIQEVKSRGGLPEKLFRYEALLQKAIETLRADFKILETGGYQPIIKKVDCNISVLSGKEDSLSEEFDISMWREYTEKECSFYVFEGGHFYIHNNAEGIVNIINKTLMREKANS